MGNAYSRSSKEEKEAQGPEQNRPEPSTNANDGSELRLSLRRPFCKATGDFPCIKSPGLFSCHALSPGFDEDKGPIFRVQRKLRRQRGLQAAEAQQRQHNMDEVIYIPDDDDVPPARRQRRHGSLMASDVEYPSSAPVRQRQPEQNAHDSAALKQVNGNPPGPGFALPSREMAPAEAFMDDDDFDWNQFVNDQDGTAGSNVPGMIPGADPGLMFGLDQRSLGIPVLPADPIIRRDGCINEVMNVFPDICRDHVSALYDEGVGQLSEQLIARILDNVEKGTEYPKARDKVKTLKRKRERNAEEEEELSYGSAEREDAGQDYAAIARLMLSGEFSDTPMAFIDATLFQTKRLLFPAYRILEEAERTWTAANPPYNRIKTRRKMNRHYYPDEAEKALKSEATTPELMEALRELKAARRVRKRAEEKREAEKEAELAEEENVKKAQAEGTMLDCGCCFDGFPLNRMVHCENDPMHWFCRNCAKQTAETEIGNQKYHITCMSMDGCHATFSASQKTIFLDEKALIALDRNEQEAMLRLAGIENLESCPFCPFAAEYPPIEENKEFRCQAEDCEKVSCRICRLESHIPKTCEESAKDNGLSIRRQIEEAMSAALIRKCNKCGTPFVKDEGCNKMTCTRPGCRNVQCYVCSKSCTYDHFNDKSRGGKPGNCPLFESVEERHEQEVSRAEREALDRVRAEHPEYTEDDLKIKVSEKVRQDEEKRKTNNPRNAARAGVAAGFAEPGQVLRVAHLPVNVGIADPLGGHAAHVEAVLVEHDRVRAQQGQLVDALPFAENELELMFGFMPDHEIRGRVRGWEDFAFYPPHPADPMGIRNLGQARLDLENLQQQVGFRQQQLGLQLHHAQPVIQDAPRDFYEDVELAHVHQHQFMVDQQWDLEAGRENLQMQQQRQIQLQQGAIGHAQGPNQAQAAQAVLPPDVPVRPASRRQH